MQSCCFVKNYCRPRRECDETKSFLFYCRKVNDAAILSVRMLSDSLHKFSQIDFCRSSRVRKNKWKYLKRKSLCVIFRVPRVLLTPISPCSASKKMAMALVAWRELRIWCFSSCCYGGDTRHHNLVEWLKLLLRQVKYAARPSKLLCTITMAILSLPTVMFIAHFCSLSLFFVEFIYLRNGARDIFRNIYFYIFVVLF